jgi:hypothetical protein
MHIGHRHHVVLQCLVVAESLSMLAEGAGGFLSPLLESVMIAKHTSLRVIDSRSGI